MRFIFEYKFRMLSGILPSLDSVMSSCCYKSMYKTFNDVTSIRTSFVMPTRSRLLAKVFISSTFSFALSLYIFSYQAIPSERRPSSSAMIIFQYEYNVPVVVNIYPFSCFASLSVEANTTICSKYDDPVSTFIYLTLAFEIINKSGRMHANEGF